MCTTLEQTRWSPSPEALGRVLRQARLANDLTQDDVAEYMDVNRRCIIELEPGKSTLALTRLFEYMTAMESSCGPRSPERLKRGSERAERLRSTPHEASHPGSPVGH